MSKYNLVPMVLAFITLIVIGVPAVTVFNVPAFPAMAVGVFCGAVIWPLLTIWISTYTDSLL